jgi:hypothetical protein
MSFLIKLQEDNPSIIIEYEKTLIYSVVEMNSIYVDTHTLPSLCLGCLGIKYLDFPSKSGYLEIDHISEMLQKGYGKCDSIVAWFIMMYQREGVDAEPLIVPTNKGGFHVKMRYLAGNNWIELDPSINLNKILYDACDQCRQAMHSGRRKL